MKKYLLKRILFSIFSLLVVVMVVMLLVYSLIERNVIFQSDDVWNKKSGNDRAIYEYTMYQKYGYVTYVNYSSFLMNKYSAKYGDEYSKEKDYTTDMKIIQTLFKDTSTNLPLFAVAQSRLELIDCTFKNVQGRINDMDLAGGTVSQMVER